MSALTATANEVESSREHERPSTMLPIFTEVHESASEVLTSTHTVNLEASLPVMYGGSMREMLNTLGVD
jgi:hypothetical protein